MMDLPKTFGPLTLLRALGPIGRASTYEGVLVEQGRRRVFVRHIARSVDRDPMEQAAVETRVKDLAAVRHPFLVAVLDTIRDKDHLFVVEEWVEGLSLDEVIRWCRQQSTHLPGNVLLHVAMQVCDGLEALHGRTGRSTSQAHVLHLGLCPAHVFLSPEGKVLVGGYGLERAPVLLGEGADVGPEVGLEYLSPEQTRTDQKLLPASDIFALGAVLHELATLEPLFRDATPQLTIQRVRRAEVGAKLRAVEEILPGLDKVLHRALSSSPRHRYQRAFVLKEDLRGLMTDTSFQAVEGDIRAFLAPLLGIGPHPSAQADPASTASWAARALAQRDASAKETGCLEDFGEGDSVPDTPVMVAVGLKPDPDFPMPKDSPAADTAAFLADRLSPPEPPVEEITDTRPWLPEPSAPSPPAPLAPPPVEAGVEEAFPPRVGVRGPTDPTAPLDPPPPARRVVALLVLAGIAGVLVVAGLIYATWRMRTPDAPAPGAQEAAPTLALDAPTAEEPLASGSEPTEGQAVDAPVQAEEVEAPPSSPPTSPSRRPSGAIGPAPVPEPIADIGPIDREPPNSNALLDRFAATATAGKLTPSDVMVIEMVQDDDLGFDRSRMLLLMNARARQDSTALKLYLDELSSRPENAYNPVILSEYARYFANKGDYQRALDKARLAERHWARLPSDLIFLKKAEIYEVQAASYQGLFYRSEDDVELLDAALSSWQRYREHVNSGSRTDLATRADREITKLETIRKRLR